MKRLGILAYGSLIDDPGKEINAVTVCQTENVLTPFELEFARSSRTRGGGPTLVPVKTGGARVKAQILVLGEGISEKQATDMLWRRETHQVCSGNVYKRPQNPGKNTVLVEQLKNFHNVDLVLYTKIAPNIKLLTPQKLAKLAIDSARSEAGIQGLDGISYLIKAKQNGIQTSLMPQYENEILRELKATSLEGALRIIQEERQSGFGLFSCLFCHIKQALKRLIKWMQVDHCSI